MTMGNQARLREFKKSGTNAGMIGHAVLECASSTREDLCADILGGLDKLIQDLERVGSASDVAKRSRDDLLRAMDGQKIAPKPQWREPFEAVVAADKKARDDQRANVAKAREKRQSRQEFADWQARRSEEKRRLAERKPPGEEDCGDGA